MSSVSNNIDYTVACSIPIVQTVVGLTVAIDNLTLLIEDICKICQQSMEKNAAVSNLDQIQVSYLQEDSKSNIEAFKIDFLNHFSALCIAIISAIPVVGSLYNGAQLAYLGAQFIYEELYKVDSTLESTIKNLLRDKKFEVVGSIINRFNLKDQAGLLDIAKFCVSKPNFLIKNIKLFRFESQDELIKIYKACVDKGAKILMDNLPDLGIEKEEDLIEIIRLIAMVRPDLVLESIDTLGIKDQLAIDSIISMCLDVDPYYVTSEKIDNWVTEHQELLHSDTNILVKKIKDVGKIPPNILMQKTFDVFKKFSEDPALELLGRTRWMPEGQGTDELYNSPTKNFRGIEIPTSRCSMTVAALLKSMFGHQGLEHQLKKEVFEERAVKRGLNKTWAIIRENETQFEGKSPSHFFAYSLGSLGIDHIFVVIQHRDEENNVKYRILQSWVGDHYLNDYISNRGADLSSEEFLQFQEGFNSTLLHKHWTNEKAVFFNKYFMKKEIPEIGSDSLRSRQTFTLEWGSSNLDAVLLYKNQFEKFKAQHFVCSI